MNRCCADSRGATMVFGLFFAMFLLACVYRLHGMAEAILYRQHQQDAADAAAFAAGVVSARGMNLIALINMSMAALLAVLVGLRLAQILCMVGILLCGALSWPTMGQSLSYIPKLTQLTIKLENRHRQVAKKLPPILNALHGAGKAVSVVIPLGANARVMEVATVQHEQELGVAIPGRLTLPVEDGKFYDLCRHAGQLAAQVALLPVSPILSARISEALSGAVGAMAGAKPDWFCGQMAQGDKPNLDPGGDLDPIRLPILPQQQACNDLASQLKESEASEAKTRELEDVCSAAAIESLAATPGRDGKAREGERLCPSDCDTQPRPSCPPEENELCSPERAVEIDKEALRLGKSPIVPGGKASPFGQRLRLAFEQCHPWGAHSYPLGGFAWTQRKITYVYEWVPAEKAESLPKKGPSPEPSDTGVYLRHELEIEHPQTTVWKKDEDRTLPCGPSGVISEAYGSLPDLVCEGLEQCSNALGQPVEESHCAHAGYEPLKYWKTVVRVTSILQCLEQRPHQKVETPDLDMEKELEQSKQKGQNTSPFQLEKGTWLGGSDFQVRAVTVGKTFHSVGEQAVRLSTWGHAGNESALSDASAKLGRLAVSQAEFYFDLSVFTDYGNQLDEDDRVEWTWNQGWVARLRPFRLRHSKADGPRDKPVALDSEQAALAQDGSATPPQDLSACGEPCAELTSLLAGADEEATP